jgi:hypothetical protein
MILFTIIKMTKKYGPYPHFQEDSNTLKYVLFGYCMNKLWIFEVSSIRQKFYTMCIYFWFTQGHSIWFTNNKFTMNYYINSIHVVLSLNFFMVKSLLMNQTLWSWVNQK